MAISSFLIISCLVALGSGDYIFNGFRGSFHPNSLGKEDNNVPTTKAPQNNYLYNYNKPADNNMMKPEGPNERCVQNSIRDFRPVLGDCSKFQMCSNGMLIEFACPENAAFNSELKSCVRKGSRLDTCQEEQTFDPFVLPERPLTVPQWTTLCPRGATYKKAHPGHCARYYDCGRPAMMDRWEDHEWECKYPYLFNEDTKRCEHYSMVSCGSRKIAYDRCDYKQYECNGHSHCRPCSVTHPSCKNLPDGMNVWQGRTPSPYYVVCSDNRVVYSGMCPGGKLFDRATGICVANSNTTW